MDAAVDQGSESGSDLNLMSVTRSLRRAVPGDEPILRELRLQALSEVPEAFGSTYERELARTPSD